MRDNNIGLRSGAIYQRHVITKPTSKWRELRKMRRFYNGYSKTLEPGLSSREIVSTHAGLKTSLASTIDRLDGVSEVTSSFVDGV